ncbi:hypothetical protein [Burkholderia sp. Se-20373]|nr:hypothetical protein [Burkholderia sp. Se-20373]
MKLTHVSKSAIVPMRLHGPSSQVQTPARHFMAVDSLGNANGL